jgi:hypothetical protein
MMAPLNHIVKILFFVSYSFSVSGQMPAEEAVDYLYKKDWYIGAQLSTSGFGILFAYERNVNYKFSQGILLNIGNLKGDKEIRRTNSAYEDSRSYVFGKTNLLFAGRLTYSASWLLFERKRSRGVAIRFNMNIGPSIGMLKPIYLKIKEPYAFIPEVEPVDLRYKPNVHQGENIYGRSSIWKGFGESNVALGGYAKSGFQFDFSPNSNKITAVEIGVQLDYFTNEIELFYAGKNKKFFPALYASVQFGKNKI